MSSFNFVTNSLERFNYSYLKSLGNPCTKECRDVIKESNNLLIMSRPSSYSTNYSFLSMLLISSKINLNKFGTKDAKNKFLPLRQADKA